MFKHENSENYINILKSNSDITNTYFIELLIDKHSKTNNMLCSEYSMVYMNMNMLYIYCYEFRF